MAAIIYDFVIEQGSYSTVTFVYQDANSQNVDLRDWCVVLQWKDDQNNTKTFTNRNKNNTYDLTTYADGRIVFNLPASQTNLFTFDTAAYDLDIQEPNEQYAGSGYRTFRLASGTISLIKRAIPQSLLTNCVDIPVDTTSQNACELGCLSEDIYSVIYNGQRINILDMSENSDIINVTDNRVIEKVEVLVSGLTHKSPQDLRFILRSPDNKHILLAANQKIRLYVPGFNFVFSDTAPADQYLHTIRTNQKCRIYDKTNSVKYGNSTLFASLSELNGGSATGNWTLLVIDTDPSGDIGSISSWSLIITYIP